MSLEFENDPDKEMDPETTRVPPIVNSIRSLNISLSILIYEDRLTKEDLEWFSKDELYEIKCHSMRPEIALEAAKLCA